MPLAKALVALSYGHSLWVLHRLKMVLGLIRSMSQPKCVGDTSYGLWPGS
jgi:hypothetical protein